jgi:phage baseplate assembly protein W
MSAFEDRLGADLELLRNRRSQHDRDVGRDLSIVARRGALDLSTVAGVENIAQALLLRFLTAEGELAPLGHARYGCRLHELIGELNNEANRNVAKLHVLRALSQEPRVEKVLSATVTTAPADRGRIDIALRLKIVSSDTPLNLVFPFSFNAATEQGATP